MRRRIRFVAALVGWLLVLVVGDAVVGGGVGAVVVGGILGLFVLVELVTPATVQPRWQRRLSPILLAAVVLFVAIVGPRVFRFVSWWT